MGEADAEGGGEDAGDDQAAEGRQVDIAERVRRQVGGLPAVEDIADGAGDGDRKADGRRGADRLGAPGYCTRS